MTQGHRPSCRERGGTADYPRQPPDPQARLRRLGGLNEGLTLKCWADRAVILLAGRTGRFSPSGPFWAKATCLSCANSVAYSKNSLRKELRIPDRISGTVFWRTGNFQR